MHIASLPGRDLLHRFESDADSGFRGVDETTATMDNIVAQNQIKEVLEVLDAKVYRIHESWETRDRHVTHHMEFESLEQGMKMVSEKNCIVLYCIVPVTHHMEFESLEQGMKMVSDVVLYCIVL